jgi:hypothetical protein
MDSFTVDELSALHEILQLLKRKGWDHFAMKEDEMPELPGVTERIVHSLIQNLIKIEPKSWEDGSQIMGRSITELIGLVRSYRNAEFGAGTTYIIGHDHMRSDGNGNIIYTPPPMEVKLTRRFKEMKRQKAVVLKQIRGDKT